MQKRPRIGIIEPVNIRGSKEIHLPMNCTKLYHQNPDIKECVEFSATTDAHVLERFANAGDADAMFWLAYKKYFDDFDDDCARQWLLRAISDDHK